MVRARNVEEVRGAALQDWNATQNITEIGLPPPLHDTSGPHSWAQQWYTVTPRVDNSEQIARSELFDSVGNNSTINSFFATRGIGERFVEYFGPRTSRRGLYRLSSLRSRGPGELSNAVDNSADDSQQIRAPGLPVHPLFDGDDGYFRQFPAINRNLPSLENTEGPAMRNEDVSEGQAGQGRSFERTYRDVLDPVNVTTSSQRDTSPRAAPLQHMWIYNFRHLARAPEMRMRAERSRLRGRGDNTEDESRGRTARRSRSRDSPARSHELVERVAPCSFIQPGMCFKGYQSSHSDRSHSGGSKELRVLVEITQVALEKSTLSGTITAWNVPHQPGPVTTYWTGEIIDQENYTFRSHHHSTDESTDWSNWSQFSAFSGIRSSHVVSLSGISLNDIRSTGCVFMRWKERSFVSKMVSGQCERLTIAGFYYICLDRSSGVIEGSYCDPSDNKAGLSSWLQLEPELGNQKSGYSFGSVSFS